MTREIKFRGKLLNKQEGDRFIIGSLLVFRGKYFISPFLAPYIHWLEVDPKTVGELTSLYDKNGKEIWEGDIISVMRLSGGELTREVVEFKYSGFQPFCKQSYYHTGKTIFENYAVEVLGNFYENPELLESTNA